MNALHSLRAALLGLAGFAAVAQAGDWSRVCHSGEAAGSGRCPAQPASGAAATDWGCTRDNASGLLWELKTADGGPRDREKTFTNFSADYDPSKTRGSGTDAAGYVAAVNARALCSAGDWRLPSLLELFDLAQHGAAANGLAIDIAAFPNSASSAAKSVYWSASGHAANRSQAWAVDFSDGVAGDDNRSIYYALRLVRGARPAAARAASADGSEVRDGRLAWRRCAEGMSWSGSACTGTASALTWEQAQQRAKSLAAASGLDWRLPTVKELASLVDDRRADPAIDTALFPATPAQRFWSSTPSLGDVAHVWTVHFGSGHSGNHGYRHDVHALRLVRSAR